MNANVKGAVSCLSDLEALRTRAREQIMKGAVTPSFPEADRQAIVELLNTALATEIVCVLRYKRHYFAAHGIRAKFVSQEFLEHANEEQAHADQIAERIVQLGEDPDLNPATLLSRSHSEYDEETSLRKMLEADLVAERIAIESYREMINFIGHARPDIAAAARIHPRAGGRARRGSGRPAGRRAERLITSKLEDDHEYR